MFINNKKMEIEEETTETKHKSEDCYKETQQFLQNYFSCFNCNEIGKTPFLLNCDHTYCEKCISDFNMKEKNGSIICRFCYKITEANQLLSQMELKFFLNKINSINDDSFRELFNNKIKFISSNNKLNKKDIISFLLKNESIELKQMTKAKRKNNQKRIYKNIIKDKQNEEKYDFEMNNKKVALKYS